MKNIKIKLLILGLLILTVSTLYVPTVAKATITKETNTETISIGISPIGAIYYEKTVEKFYTSFESIPASIIEKEWSNAYQYYFTGTLNRTKVIKGTFGYTATFTGIMQGSGL